MTIKLVPAEQRVNAGDGRRDPWLRQSLAVAKAGMAMEIIEGSADVPQISEDARRLQFQQTLARGLAGLEKKLNQLRRRTHPRGLCVAKCPVGRYT